MGTQPCIHTDRGIAVTQQLAPHRHKARCPPLLRTPRDPRPTPPSRSGLSSCVRHRGTIPDDFHRGSPGRPRARSQANMDRSRRCERRGFRVRPAVAQPICVLHLPRPRRALPMQLQLRTPADRRWPTKRVDRTSRGQVRYRTSASDPLRRGTCVIQTPRLGSPAPG